MDIALNMKFLNKSVWKTKKAQKYTN